MTDRVTPRFDSCPSGQAQQAEFFNDPRFDGLIDEDEHTEQRNDSLVLEELNQSTIDGNNPRELQQSMVQNHSLLDNSFSIARGQTTLSTRKMMPTIQGATKDYNQTIEKANGLIQNNLQGHPIDHRGVQALKSNLNRDIQTLASALRHNGVTNEIKQLEIRTQGILAQLNELAASPVQGQGKRVGSFLPDQEQRSEEHTSELQSQ